MNVQQILDSLTLEEKASLLAGSTFWHTRGIERKGIGRMMLTDGPHGLRKQLGAGDHLGLNESAPATAFPAACATACSFDVDLLHSIGQALGEECRKEDVAVILGPGLNIKRHPLCGRNFEYFSEDPLLAGTLAAAMVRGVQSCGVGACPKHLCANNQEHARLVSDSVIDDRALNEIYLRPFEIAVREGAPWTIMGAYNKLNGIHCTENPALLTDKLRGMWGFDGLTVTDWGALTSYDDSLPAGLDLVMPGPEVDYAPHIVDAVKGGAMPLAVVDQAAGRVLRLMSRVEQGKSVAYACDMRQHLQLARRAACESAVLLENDGTLPLRPGATIAVIGAFARRARYQGAGSSHVNPCELDNLCMALDQAGVAFEYAPGYDVQTGSSTPEQLDAAVELAGRCDVAIVMAGLPESYESEAFDRTSMQMPQGHVSLIERVCAANAHTVVVLSGGAPMELPWKTGTCPTPAAVLLAYLAGCQSGGALADLLTGKANPSGKLAETWPVRLGDTALGTAFPQQGHSIRYVESIYVGYRYYDAARVQPAYAFGFGLSYTTFEYANLDVVPAPDGFEVSLDVTNTGQRAGAEVVQVYVSAPARTPDGSARALFMPPRQLAAFCKVMLQPGQTKRVVLHLSKMAFAHWQTQPAASVAGIDAAAAAAGQEGIYGSWVVDAGDYVIEACSSSRQVRLSQQMNIAVGQPPFDACQPQAATPGVVEELAPYYHVQAGCFEAAVAPQPADAVQAQAMSRAFEALYGRAIPQEAPDRPYTMESVLPSMRQSALGRKVWFFLEKSILKRSAASDNDINAMTLAMMDDMPFRMMTMGGPPRSLVDSLIKFLNGQTTQGFDLLFRSLRKMLRARSR